ncbi:MAG: aminotransferase class V-fold PLP-dependent enzyme [Legionellaceae bacterium]|nr:aminotransferase class V-fold PLP-dependent enzyme [Legionellaceae bacterium]
MNYQLDFPIIENLKSSNRPYVYLDNAATSLKPISVIEAVSNYYTHCGANVHRGSYKAGEYATILYEQARNTIAEFINAKNNEIIFSKGTTDSLNLLADLLELKKEDVIINCLHDHHANFIVWKERACLHTVEMTPDGLINLQMLEDILKTNKVKLITIPYATNITGNIQPVMDIMGLAKKYNTLVCIDGAQIVSHRAVDIKTISADFFAFSSHKMFGPTGVGVLYIQENILEKMPYKRFGGGMINTYTLQQKNYKKPPIGFEPGTPAIEAVIGFGKAVEYILNIGFEAFNTHSSAWSVLFLKHLESSAWKLAFPKSDDSLPIFTLNHKNRTMDLAYLGRLLSDAYNIAVNDGQQCCGPLYASAGLAAGLRVSAHIYNSLTEPEYFFHCLDELSFY